MVTIYKMDSLNIWYTILRNIFIRYKQHNAEAHKKKNIWNKK